MPSSASALLCEALLASLLAGCGGPPAEGCLGAAQNLGVWIDASWTPLNVTPYDAFEALEDATARLREHGWAIGRAAGRGGADVRVWWDDLEAGSQYLGEAGRDRVGWYVVLNTRAPWTAAPCSDASAYEVSAVLEHELGHVLGLDHSSDPEDVMYPTMNRCEVKTKIASCGD